MSKRKNSNTPNNSGIPAQVRMLTIQLTQLGRGCSPTCSDYAELDYRKTLAAFEWISLTPNTPAWEKWDNLGIESQEDYFFAKELEFHAKKQGIPMDLEKPFRLLPRQDEHGFLIGFFPEAAGGMVANLMLSIDKSAFRTTIDGLFRSGVLISVPMPNSSKTLVLFPPIDDDETNVLRHEIAGLETRLTITRCLYREQIAS